MSASICVLDRPRRADERKGSRRRIRSIKQLVAELDGATARQLWVVRSTESMRDLVRAMRQVRPGVRRARLISYACPSSPLREVIESGFERVLLWAVAMVPFEDLREIGQTSHPEDHAVAATWDEETDTLSIWRGDLSVVVFSMSDFPSRRGVAPDPDDLSIEDCGQTIRMGGYEISVDALLFERDEAYRRRARKRMIREDQGLGPSIRRRRLARGVGRRDFDGIDAKTVARIERNEVNRPHKKTLEAIAERLGVSVSELGEF